MKILPVVVCVILCAVLAVRGEKEHKFYTEVKVEEASNSHSTVRCNERVFSAREKAKENGAIKVGVIPTVGLSQAFLIFVLVGIFSAGIAQVFHQIRKKFYHDADNLDTAFDAGGQVSIGLTATTIVSQWTWTATLLQSCTVASRFGISGPYWYACGASIQIIIFSVLSIMLKTKAPGAKTFLQVVKARFGSRTHLVFCLFAIFTNCIVMMMLMLGGTAVLNSLVKDLSIELACMILAVVIGGYTLIGGLGATFYVCYFNTALIFILIIILVVEVFYNPSSNDENPFGSSEALFDFLTCWKAPEGIQGNSDGSFLTFFSTGGFIFGIVNIVGNFGAVFCDQAYWQSAVAAKPRQGVWGFISGGLTWFAIPFTMATTMGLGYLGLSSSHGFPLLTDEDINKGLAAPLVAQRLLGSTGEYAMIILVLMAVMSTGSAEVIAVSFLVIYDVYQAYICPFRPDLKHGQCILCMKYKKATPGPENCSCEPYASCKQCKIDTQNQRHEKSVIKPRYACQTHGEYKEYQDHLLAYKNWWIVICTFLTIPLCLFGWAVNLNLGWTYYFVGVLIGSSVFPIVFAVLWSRTTASGMITGVVGGCFCGVISWLSFASTYDGGLSTTTFIENTGKDFPMLTGNLVSICMGGLLCCIVTMFTRKSMSPEDVEEEWEKTRDIDNPLSPWVLDFNEEMNIETAKTDRPSQDLINEKFRTAKITAYIATAFFTLVYVFIWPSSMLSVHILDLSGFNIWTFISRCWAFIAAIFIITVPLVQEIFAIVKQAKKNNMESSSIALNIQQDSIMSLGKQNQNFTSDEA